MGFFFFEKTALLRRTTLKIALPSKVILKHRVQNEKDETSLFILSFSAF